MNDAVAANLAILESLDEIAAFIHERFPFGGPVAESAMREAMAEFRKKNLREVNLPDPWIYRAIRGSRKPGRPGAKDPFSTLENKSGGWKPHSTD